MSIHLQPPSSTLPPTTSQILGSAKVRKFTNAWKNWSKDKAPPRQINPWILYKTVAPMLEGDLPTNTSRVDAWNDLECERKRAYQKAAEHLKKVHRSFFPAYQYRPRARQPQPSKPQQEQTPSTLKVPELIHFSRSTLRHEPTRVAAAVHRTPSGRHPESQFRHVLSDESMHLPSHSCPVRLSHPVPYRDPYRMTLPAGLVTTQLEGAEASWIDDASSWCSGSSAPSTPGWDVSSTFDAPMSSAGCAQYDMSSTPLWSVSPPEPFGTSSFEGMYPRHDDSQLSQLQYVAQIESDWPTYFYGTPSSASSTSSSSYMGSPSPATFEDFDSASSFEWDPQSF